jgi:hypothetical protein
MDGLKAVSEELLFNSLLLRGSELGVRNILSLNVQLHQVFLSFAPAGRLSGFRILDTATMEQTETSERMESMPARRAYLGQDAHYA